MRLSEFDFALPPERIAHHPARPRDAARLLVVGDALHDRLVRDLPRLLRPGDVLVAITRERGSHAVYLLEKQGVRRLDILQYISHGVGREGGGGDEDPEGGNDPASTGDEDSSITFWLRRCTEQSRTPSAQAVPGSPSGPGPSAITCT